MENPIRPFTHIMHDSPEAIKATREYQQQVENIRAAIKQKYTPVLAHEKNIIKKLFLLIRKRHETIRAIRQLTSPDKLYLTVR